MTRLGALIRIEVRRLYRQPLVWFVLALGQGLLAVWFFLLVVRYLEHDAELRSAGVTAEIVVRYFSGAYWSILLIAPLLTMNSLAGDKRTGMLRFLYTTPISSATLVAMKLAGVLAMGFGHVVLVAVLPLTLLWGAEIDLGVYAGNVLGLGLFCLLHLCLGVSMSALTRSPIAAALLTLAISLSLWFIDWAARLEAQTVAVSAWSTLTHLRGFTQGLLISVDAVYFLCVSMAAVGVCIAAVNADRKLS